MSFEGLSAAEIAVQEAFPHGGEVDLSGQDDAVIRASVIRALLLDERDDPAGELPALRVRGARVTGVLDLQHADIRHPIRLRDCRFDAAPDLYNTRLRQLDLSGSSFPGLLISAATIESTLRLRGCRSTGVIRLAGTRISGALILDGARVEHAGTAIDATRLQVGDDVIGHDGFTCLGEIELKSAEIAGSIRFEGARLSNPGGSTIRAMDLTVGAIMNCCAGFSSDGEINISFSRIHSRVCFEEARLSSTVRSALRANHLQANELVLPKTDPVEGTVELNHARVRLIRDDPATWPRRLLQDGLVYEALDPRLPAEARLGWLAHDTEGATPHAYEQLAAAYRRLGLDADARTVLLAKQRDRRRTLPGYARLWGHLQDGIVGYGYRPLRAAAWLTLLLAAGTVYFTTHRPAPVEPGKGPAFNPAMYTLDLLLPVVDFHQEAAFQPTGTPQWIAYALIAAGWLLATTIATGITRNLSRT
ncbi:hypothetical protein [Sphaerisporangium sp. TRM90804]|uniref:hypothetical protein n=1 Tax=Sphaerisporangium sp. TRM90804 TaxID=3031113 RepID=UPI002449F503|nr:hypothetical protein [Sphaerisporangium sp. TRM90804]MDH2427968.1 hypothetical protein [Sphaerisporangium sp. TRM90804]